MHILMDRIELFLQKTQTLRQNSFIPVSFFSLTCRLLLQSTNYRSFANCYTIQLVKLNFKPNQELMKASYHPE